jgi:F420H(2)-dependent quinone reductase
MSAYIDAPRGVRRPCGPKKLPGFSRLEEPYAYTLQLVERDDPALHFAERSWSISVPHELRITGASRAARKVATARTQAEWDLAHVSQHHRSMRVACQLRRRRVDADPRHVLAEHGREPPVPAADIEHRAAQFAGDGLVLVLLWLPGLPSPRVAVVIRADHGGFHASLSYHARAYVAHRSCLMLILIAMPTEAEERYERNSRVIEEFRRNGGRERTLLLTTTGARTGAERNLRKNPLVTIEVGTEKYQARATPLEGQERDRLFAKQKEAMPIFAEYEVRTDRVIPVIALERTS